MSKCIRSLIKMQLNVIVLVYVLLFECTSAIPGHSTAGVNFVITLPLRFNETQAIAGEIFVSTEEWRAFVTVLEPSANRNSAVRRKIIYVVDQNTTLIHVIDKDRAVNKPGIYYATLITSNAPIRVYALSTNFFKSDADVFRVMPEQSCYQSYYVTTAIGHPFLMVFSFQRGAKVSITFPRYETPFRVDCGLSALCVSEDRLDLILKPCSVWYLTIEEKDFQLQYTLIESDNPVYVVSGNSKCVVSDRSTDVTNISGDFCVNAMTPTVTWGREYFVPIFYRSEKSAPVLLRLSALKFPFSMMIYEGDNGTNVIIDDYQHIYRHAATNEFIFVKADDPFGLHLFISRSKTNKIFWDTTLISIIPVAQWMNGVVYVKADMEKGFNFSSYRLYLVTQTNTTDILLPEPFNNSVTWKPALVVNNKSYSFIELYHKDSTTKIFTKKPGGKIMLYVKGYLKERASVTLSYDFYQAEINSPNCTQNKALVSDGVDNDCDGEIDEEIDNKKDDDGDGLVDEDYVEAYQDGIWGAWEHVCDIPKCKQNKMFVNISIRSCNKKSPSRFGQPCPGINYKCTPYEVCPGKCLADCQCQVGCTNCSKTTPMCERCKPGYLATEFCRVPCPQGWGGRGCFQAYRSIAGDDAISVGVLFSIIMTSVLSLVILAICLRCLFRITKQDQQSYDSEYDEYGDKEREEEMGEEEKGDSIEDDDRESDRDSIEDDDRERDRA